MLESSGHDHSRRVHDPEGISPTATAVVGGTHHIKIFDHTKYRVRKLTPTEYGRLQAFPMDRWKQVVSNSQAYKQFGNAVTHYRRWKLGYKASGRTGTSGTRKFTL